MKVFKINITSFTSSFRYPNIISGFQPSLEVPPVSTILGMINAASGTYREYEALEIAYYFQFEAKGIDLETIYQIESRSNGGPSNSSKANVIKREFLYNNYLALYTLDAGIAHFFKCPHFSLLLGRSNDLATVESIDEVELTQIDNASRIKGQIVPFKGNFLQGQIQALPKYFTDTIPRQNLGTEPYSVISHEVPDFATNINAFRDETLQKGGVDLYFHNLNFPPL